MAMEKKRIIVIGGGFAGLNFVKKLMNHPRYEITLVDKNNYHYFPPLLYQVGMAFIELSNITYPFRRLFQKKRNIRFHLGSLVRINANDNSIETETHTLNYDYLVLALGTETNYFGMEHVKLNSWPLKTITDALNLRNKILLNVEKAVKTQDLAQRQCLLTVVIAGGGPTGVEVAGMLAELIRTVGPREYPEIPKGTARVYLVQSGPVLLNGMSKTAQDEAYRVLRNLGVRILLKTRVKDYVDGKVVLDHGEPIPCSAVLWTSGVIAREVKGLSKESIGASRRILVDKFNKVAGTSNVFAIGDISLMKDDQNYPNGHPQLAQVAIQQGKTLAENLKHSFETDNWQPFVYRNKGTMAIISKYKAVADLPRFSVKGFVAWLMWLFIHLIPIAGFRNKLALLLNWAWSFITNNPTLRLIVRPERNEFQRGEDLVSTPNEVSNGQNVSNVKSVVAER
jgi:NADH:ubiquinone reductase (H+-translocating)